VRGDRHAGIIGIRPGIIHFGFTEAFMGNAFVVLVAASQILYVAQVSTFGCNSSDEVSKLQQFRSDEKAFQSLLNEQIVLGECVRFLKGAVVEGSIVNNNTSLLHIQAQVDPPGYIAPLDDFKLKGTVEEKQ
jgi:hypothetical protein